MSPVTLEVLTEQLELADQLLAGREVMLNQPRAMACRTGNESL